MFKPINQSLFYFYVVCSHQGSIRHINNNNNNNNNTTNNNNKTTTEATTTTTTVCLPLGVFVHLFPVSLFVYLFVGVFAYLFVCLLVSLWQCLSFRGVLSTNSNPPAVRSFHQREQTTECPPL